MATDKQVADAELKQLQVRLAQADLELKHAELRIKEQGIRNTPTFWKAVLASPVIIAAIIAAAASWSAARIADLNAKAQREGQLIIDATKTGDPDQAAVNLRFLLDAGLVSDPEGRIKASNRKPGTGRALPPG